MRAILSTLRHDHSAATAVEYALVAFLVSVAGFVTYSNAAKAGMLGVPKTILDQFGAVSRQTAEAMAQGALAQAPVELAASITGIAGPGGATAGKAVGLVHFAVAARGGRLIHCVQRYGDIGRAQVRRASVRDALAMLRELAEEAKPPP